MSRKDPVSFGDGGTAGAVAGQVDAGGVRIAYESVGQGPPLLLCHAFAMDRTMWQPQIGRFAVGHRVVTFDQRGSGLSDHPEEMGAYSIDGFADDVCAVLDDLGIQQTRLLGFSMGAATAIRFATRHPERVESLVLASAMASRLPDEIVERARKVVEVLERDGLDAAYRFYFGGAMFAGVDAADESSPIMAATAARATPHGFAGCYRVTIDRSSMVEDLHRITARTLILVGERDVHYLKEADLMQQRIPDARKVIVPGVGHAMSVEAPDLFNDEVVRFLALGAS